MSRDCDHTGTAFDAAHSGYSWVWLRCTKDLSETSSYHLAGVEQGTWDEPITYPYLYSARSAQLTARPRLLVEHLGRGGPDTCGRYRHVDRSVATHTAQTPGPKEGGAGVMEQIGEWLKLSRCARDPSQVHLALEYEQSLASLSADHCLFGASFSFPLSRVHALVPGPLQV